MFDQDAIPSKSQPKTTQYLRKYALLYGKCAKGLDVNVSPEDMNKELIRMAGYYIYLFFFKLIENIYCFIIE